MEKTKLIFRENQWLTLSLMSLSLLYFFQNYFKYSTNEHYNMSRSLVFNLLVFGLFVVVFPVLQIIIQKLGQHFQGIKLSIWYIVLPVLILLPYAICTSIVLHLIGFLSDLISPYFLEKYFLNIATFHLISGGLFIHFNKNQFEAKNNMIDCLKVSRKDQEVVCKLVDIVRIEAMDHYVKVHTKEASYIKKTSLTKLSEALDQKQFVRIHRSHLINTTHALRLIKEKGNVNVILTNGVSVRIGKTYLKKVLPLLPFTYA